MINTYLTHQWRPGFLFALFDHGEGSGTKKRRFLRCGSFALSFPTFIGAPLTIHVDNTDELDGVAVMLSCAFTQACQRTTSSSVKSTGSPSYRPPSDSLHPLSHSSRIKQHVSNRRL